MHRQAPQIFYMKLTNPTTLMHGLDGKHRRKEKVKREKKKMFSSKSCNVWIDRREKKKSGLLLGVVFCPFHFLCNSWGLISSPFIRFSSFLSKIFMPIYRGRFSLLSSLLLLFSPSK